MTQLYPVFLKLSGRKVLVVGGGNVALGKIRGLVEAGADVTVVSPTLHPELPRTGLTLQQRAFLPEDLDGARWVVAAATPEVNRAVSDEADRRGIFVNAVDDPEPASAYLGAVVRRGGVTVAISTEGEAPALAGLLREALEALIPKEVERWVETARAARKEWLLQRIPMVQRRPLLLKTLNKLYESRTDEGRVRLTDVTLVEA